MSANRQTTNRLTLEFPAIQYFPVDPRSYLTMLVLPDASWLHKFSKWPRRNRLLPGGILDSSGCDIPILDLVGWPEIPLWMRPIDAVFGSFITLGHYHVDFVFGDPVQLTLDAFKEKVCHLTYLERQFYADETDMGYRGRQKRIRKAQSYREVIDAVNT